MRREDLMKPDPLSYVLLLSSGIVLFAALVTLMVLAVVPAFSFLYNVAIGDLQPFADMLSVRLAV
jgi:hypothetical protein